MSAIVAALHRYPVKSLSPQALDRVELTEGTGFPLDRRYALALPETAFDPADPKPISKYGFVVLARRERLARLRTSFDVAASRLEIRLDGDLVALGDPETPAGRAAIEDFFESFVGPEIGGRPRLVAAPGHRFTDASVKSERFMQVVSLLNLESVRDLERRIGAPVDPLRFRANIHVDGLPAWAEMEWVDRDIALGDLRFQGAAKTTRCPATEVDPATGERDLRTPKLLQEQYGHVVMGIYLDVKSGGTLRVGDRVRVYAAT